MHIHICGVKSYIIIIIIIIITSRCFDAHGTVVTLTLFQHEHHEEHFRPSTPANVSSLKWRPVTSGKLLISITYLRCAHLHSQDSRRSAGDLTNLFPRFHSVIQILSSSSGAQTNQSRAEEPSRAAETPANLRPLDVNSRRVNRCGSVPAMLGGGQTAGRSVSVGAAR